MHPLHAHACFNELIQEGLLTKPFILAICIVTFARLHVLCSLQAVAFGSALDQMMVAKEYKKYRPDVSIHPFNDRMK